MYEVYELLAAVYGKHTPIDLSGVVLEEHTQLKEREEERERERLIM